MKKFLMVSFIVISLLLSSCSDKEIPQLENTVSEFMTLWQKEDYASMYSLLSDSSKQQYSQKYFTDRQTEVAEKLDINDLDIQFNALTDDELTTAKEVGEATIRLDINLHTIAGNIAFSKKMPLQLVDAEDDKQWKIDWDEGFILPELKESDDIIVEHIAPKRGEILDRNKMPLALNDVAYEIGVTPEDFLDESDEKQQISNILNMSVDKIDAHLNASWVKENYFVPLTIIPSSSVDTLEALAEIPSVTYKETSGRTYPLGAAAAHLTGYIGKITKEDLEDLPEEKYAPQDLVGKAGLEQMYEEQLRGEAGIQASIARESETGAKEKEVIAEKPVQNGEHVQLTIDVNIQEKIYDAYGDKSGTATAINPKSGEVLALVSSPAYDPDTFTYGISDANWDALLDNPKKPMVNRFSATFAPGSSIKPITAAVGIGNDAIHFDEGIVIDGLTWGKEAWGDEVITRVSTSEQPVDLKDALKRSDNIYFAMKAVDMGSDAFIDGMKQIGFEETIPFTLPIKKSQISNSGDLDELLLANTGYGQGEIEMSVLHVALAYTTFLNEGNMLKPNLLLDDRTSQIWKRDIINAAEAKKINTYLRAAVKDGTAKNADDKDLPISGKTGTAELKLTKDTDGQQNGWFVGYPTDDEDILIAMMMEHVENDGSSGFVANKVKNLLKEIKK